MRFIGVDPGLRGGIAVISPNAIEAFPMPILSQGKKRVYDHLALKRFFSSQSDDSCYAVLEQQQAMPKQGVVSMMSIGYGFGALKQCLVDFAIPHEVVHARVWQKEFGISSRKGNTKVQALRICQDLFPGVNLLATPRSKKPHDGIVDALLIAEYAKRRHNPTLER